MERTNKVEIRPTTQDDVDRFLGRSLPYRARAFTGLVDGEIKGIGGIAYIEHGLALAFLHLAPDAQRYAVSLHKAAHRVIKEAQQRGIRKIVAQADEGFPTADRWLRRLGFEPIQVDGEKIYLWQS